MGRLARHVAQGLGAFLVVDSIACAIPLRYIKDDLDHIGCPERLQALPPAIKGTAAVGLLAGLKSPRLGTATCVALIPYFTAAVAFHLQAGHGALRTAPAVAVGAWVLAAERSYRSLGAAA